MKTDKKSTLVIGASTNPSRYSYLAINSLRQHGHKVIAIGLRNGKVGDVGITAGKPLDGSIDTVTLYIGPKIQSQYTEYVKALNPRRVIFNPGTENKEFENKLKEAGIEVIEACTLVMLSTGQY
ncbi:Predicted CoA-binding domain COG1832 [hydrothermal vent metagenome]|uniref:Predicted CoA-binding domain COG1832 n=1 Tax=hydrothermal vent metagenome TaxID=652676 RepID=A0A3B0UW71_9ZZZZ